MSKHVPEGLLKQFCEEGIPFNKWLGVQMLSWEAGEVLMCIPFREELVGNPFIPALHGGIIAALIDAAGGAAVFTQLGPHDRTSTVDMRIDYLRPAKPLDLYCRAKTVRHGNRVAAVSAVAFHEDKESEPVAMGMAVYNVKKVEGGMLGPNPYGGGGG